MKPKEIRGMDVKVIDEKLTELKKELIKLNAQIAVGTTIKNPGQVKKIKKTIARVLTIKHEKENKETKSSNPVKGETKKEGKVAEKKSKEAEKKQEVTKKQ